MRNAVDAAVASGTRLVYLDNIYAYGRVAGPMTEQTPVRPASRKGRVRADALRLLEAAVVDRALDLTVVRSADFYGPGATTSVFNGFVLDRLAAGRPPGWLLDADQPHSLTYTPDLGEALAVAGTTAAARGRVWHAPTAPACTARGYAALAAGSPVEVKVMGRTTLRLGALFNRSARSTLEMGFQYSAPSVLDSTAFESEFGIAPTPIQTGIATVLAPRGARN